MPWMHSPCLTSKAMENCIQLFALKVLPLGISDRLLREQVSFWRQLGAAAPSFCC